MPASSSSRIGLGALRALARRPFASLPSRIITLVFSAALVTSVAVTWTATGATEIFLRRQIGQRFPVALERISERLDDWYGQRERDLDTFSRSDTVVGSLGGSERALREARRYLAYVQEGFPHYRALFVLDAAGVPRVWVGAQPGLPDTLLAGLSRVDRTQVGDLHRVDGERVHFVSAPLSGPGGEQGSLHAIVAVDVVSRLIAGDERPRTGRIVVVADGGEVVAQTGEATDAARAPSMRPGNPAVQEYLDAGGERWVGCVRRFPRFDWSLVVEEPYDSAFAPVVSVIRNTLAINIAIVLGCGSIALWIARSIVRPIRTLSDEARRIAQGEHVVIPVIPGQDEIGVLSRALSEMVTRLQQNQLELEQEKAEKERANAELRNMNEELRRGNEVLEQLSFTDGLTRLHNHRYFQDRLRVEVRRADRTGEQLALLLVDIDDFKALNDRYGHAIGDQVLRQVASVLNETVREADLPARYGGEEFVVLAPHTGRIGALALGEKLRGAISRTRFEAEGLDAPEGLEVTVSIGVSIYAGDARRLFNDADRALFQAKATGKDCVIFAGDLDAP